ncbi:MAG: cell division ATP-binding protein FtsE [Oscillospiraceae bacterium]|nr:cell division ATP-binding protein FtsE [Oscillospiraceae bacterium]
MISLIDVDLVYENGTRALNKINIEILKGEFVFIVGSSGAGKSSILKLLLRESKATRGIIRVNGFNLSSIKSKKISQFRRTLGVVFQDFRLIPTLNIFENVAFALRVIGEKQKNIKQKVPKILKELGILHKIKAMPSQLSGGEQQRVALARALINDPSIIIADEPTGNIDPELSEDIVELLKKINLKGTTVVMVTHEHSLVNYFGGRVLDIDKGLVVSDSYIGGKNEIK